jgi:hypothetical protein
MGIRRNLDGRATCRELRNLESWSKNFRRDASSYNTFSVNRKNWEPLAAALNCPLMPQVSHFFFNSGVHLFSSVRGAELLEGNELIRNRPSGATSYW